MAGVVFRRLYRLGDEYDQVKERAERVLGRYLGDPSLFRFDEGDRAIEFASERVMPQTTGRPRVMLLFSNPHPHSVKQGMFLSPNRRGGENLFWPAMEEAGWIPVPKAERTPERLAQTCLAAGYEGPFELVFYCYWAFPTDYPEDIPKVFGRELFDEVIQPEAAEEFRRTVGETGTRAVVTFNKGIFGLVTGEPVERYVERLTAGEVIQGTVRGLGNDRPIFLTYPTGWRYHTRFRELRRASLERIRRSISGED